MVDERVRSFKDLRVWQTAMSLTRAIYAATASLPPEERYGLGGQIRRAAISVPSNIAEGNGRQHPKEYVQLICIAIGSLRELETLWILCQDLGYAEPSPEIDELLDKSGRMLNCLRTTIRSRT